MGQKRRVRKQYATRREEAVPGRLVQTASIRLGDELCNCEGCSGTIRAYSRSGRKEY
jgi:hypothetical protein